MSTTVTPESITVQSFTTPVLTGYDQRTLKAFVVADTFPNGDQHRVSLSVSHDADRKSFRVSVARYTREASDGGPFAVEHYALMDDIASLGGIRVARYSRKALDQTFADALPVAVAALQGPLADFLRTPTTAR